MKNKILVGTVIVLSVLLLLMGGYIVYDKSNDNVLDNKNEVTDKENVDNETIKVAVLDNKVIKEEGRLSKNISIPKLVIGGVEITAFNQKIEQDLSNRFDRPQMFEHGNFKLNAIYKYLIVNNLVSIVIDTQISPWPASGNGNVVYSYFYDLKNNKQVNGYEALLMSGYTDTDIMNIAKECLTSTPDGMPTYGSCELDYVKSVLEMEQLNNGSSFSIENGKLKLNWYESAV